MTSGDNTLYLNKGENYPIGEELSQSDVEKIIGMPISSLLENKYSNVVIVEHENAEEEELTTYYFGAGFITYGNTPEHKGLAVNFYSFSGGLYSESYLFTVNFDADGNYTEGSFMVS